MRGSCMGYGSTTASPSQQGSARASRQVLGTALRDMICVFCAHPPAIGLPFRQGHVYLHIRCVQGHIK
jgi:hypothetical protein